MAVGTVLCTMDATQQCTAHGDRHREAALLRAVMQVPPDLVTGDYLVTGPGSLHRSYISYRPYGAENVN